MGVAGASHSFPTAVCLVSLCVLSTSAVGELTMAAEEGKDVSADSPALWSVSTTEREFLHTSRWYHSASHKRSCRPEVKYESVAPWTCSSVALQLQGWMVQAVVLEGYGYPSRTPTVQIGSIL